jgi:hypothetical protein
MDNDDLLKAAILRQPPDVRLPDTARCLSDIREFVVEQSGDEASLMIFDRLVADIERRAKQKLT